MMQKVTLRSKNLFDLDPSGDYNLFYKVFNSLIYKLIGKEMITI